MHERGVAGDRQVTFLMVFHSTDPRSAWVIGVEEMYVH